MLANTSRGGSRVIAAAWAGAAAALGVAIFWGFTVDDAWITARVAWRLANGAGYRFNAAGPPVDAVTPLGWVYALVPFARRSPAGALQFARYSGAIAWIVAAAWFGSNARRAAKNPYYTIGLFAGAPLGAWSSAGMETGFIVALCTLALGESLGATLAAAIAAALRPELIPFCSILALRRIGSKRKDFNPELRAASGHPGFANRRCSGSQLGFWSMHPTFCARQAFGSHPRASLRVGCFVISWSHLAMVRSRIQSSESARTHHCSERRHTSRIDNPGWRRLDATLAAGIACDARSPLGSDMSADTASANH